MARPTKNTPPVEQPVIDTGVLARDLETHDAKSEAVNAFSAGLAEHYTNVGRSQAFKAMSKVSTIGDVRAIQNIKESGTWKLVPVNIPGVGVSTVESFDDYCKFGLGMSKSRVYEDLSFLEVFEDAYDSLKLAGISRVEMRTLAKLPTDRLLQVKQFKIDTKDPDSIRDLIEELVAEAEDAKADLAISEASNQKGVLALDAATKRISRLEGKAKREASADPHGARIKQFEADVLDASGDAAQLIRKDLADIVAELHAARDAETDPLVLDAALEDRVTQAIRQAFDRNVAALRETAIALGVDPFAVGIAGEEFMPADFK